MNTKLSICTTVKNRSKVHFEGKDHYLFKDCVESIVNSLYSYPIELVITDWQSTDYPIMEWIEDVVGDHPTVDTHVITINGEGFSAGKGRNIAAEYASNNMLFFIDADMIFNRDVLIAGLDAVSKGGVYFPEVKYMKDDRGNAESYYGGAGNLFISRENFYKAGKWPEYWEHSFEDIDFSKTIKDMSIPIIQPEHSIYMIHQYHPQDKEWKNRYAKPTDIQKKEVEDRKNYYKIKENEEIEIIRRANAAALKEIDARKRIRDNTVGRDFPRIGVIK